MKRIRLLMLGGLALLVCVTWVTAGNEEIEPEIIINTTLEEAFCYGVGGVYAGQTNHHVICESYYLGELENIMVFFKNAMKD